MTAADPAIWYWQNPLPRLYSIWSVACRSVAACVAVGYGGTIVTTGDGGRHWMERKSGTQASLTRVTCPGRRICYAAGSRLLTPWSEHHPATVQNTMVATSDGGRTWRQTPRHLPDSPLGLGDLACPALKTCLAVIPSVQPQSGTILSAILRTTDGGKTWRRATLHGPLAINSVTCATRAICYAAGSSSATGSIVLRSVDSGRNWRRMRSSPDPLAMACPAANTCFATASRCGAECADGALFLTRDGAKPWKELADLATDDLLTSIACPRVATCYAAGGRSVALTTNGGKTWSMRHVSDPLFGSALMACPGPATCYSAAEFTILKTSDRFGHTGETLARSAIHNLSPDAISCANAKSCTITGGLATCSAAVFCGDEPGPTVVTVDGGRTWRMTRAPENRITHLDCPRPGICYAVARLPNGLVAIDRSADGGSTWQQRAQAADAWGMSCPTVTTCYVMAAILKTVGDTTVRALALLSTDDDGNTWRTVEGLAAAARAAGSGQATEIIPGGLSCPTATACSVLLNLPHAVPNHIDQRTIMLSTTDGGRSWTQSLVEPGGAAAPDNSWSAASLDCPSATTCYAIGGPDQSSGRVLVTHDAGATWHGVMVGQGGPVTAIGCAREQSCRVAGAGGVFATADGGESWHQELMADREPVPAFRIACPGVDACYAVAGVAIVARHAPDANAPAVSIGP